MKVFKCACGNNRFVGHQVCYHDIIVDGDNHFQSDVGCYESETPYGPYTCTVCGKEYDTLN